MSDASGNDRVETVTAFSLIRRKGYREALERVLFWQRGRLEAAGELADELSELRVIDSLGHVVIIASAINWTYPGGTPIISGATHLMAKGHIAYVWGLSFTRDRLEVLHWDDGQSNAPGHFLLRDVTFNRQPITVVMASRDGGPVMGFVGALVGYGISEDRAQPLSQFDGSGPIIELRPAYALEYYPARLPLAQSWNDFWAAPYPTADFSSMIPSLVPANLDYGRDLEFGTARGLAARPWLPRPFKWDPVAD